MQTDQFPASDFDQWAESYDADVARTGFPFTGYSQVLEEVVHQADARPGMAVLDLGAGTGNISVKFFALGCDVWGTDFSDEMLQIARAKVPAAHFLLHDLRRPFPPVLSRPFDRIVSAYVFHHFELPEKLALIERLVRESLVPGGRLVIADISFPTRQALAAVRQAIGGAWEEEPYWIAAEALPALEQICPAAAYYQVSDCAGIYQLTRIEERDSFS